MKKFIKSFVILCIVYVITQGFCHKIVLASDNENDPSSITYSIPSETTLEQDKNSDDLSENSAVDTQNQNNIDLNKENSTQDTKSKTDTYYDEDSSNSNTYSESIAKKTTTSDNENEDVQYNTLIKYNVSLTKKWKIMFNQPVDLNSLEKNIKLVDKNNTEVPITLSLEDNGTSVIVTPKNTYDAESEYILTVGKDVVSMYNKKLKNPTTVEFKTSPAIASIDDINVTIDQEASYSLPTEVEAKLSNNSTTSVGVCWDKSVERTSIPGNYTYTGTVEGYDKSVTLNLTIKPFEPVESISNEYRTQSTIGTNLYNYFMNYDNRQSVLNRAIELHSGITSNNCVYFASEGLRRAGLTDLPNYVANTVTLTSQLESRGWNSSTDFSILLPGDICFTTSYGNGPTHAYTFMGWVSEGSYDYAYVCDNQGYDYGYNDYHIRNVSIATPTKDATWYFMYTV
ncbi:Ig-like domain-containing protein [Clostridium kluyveri]|uniref:Ig-like domain-containing protein n=1 Tax=Clostridium kluyveri TaxID=1534 RepID=UPI0022479717|nr:Ig-like domain-containing protein [Clostridium kluyveri]UZQ49177.1 Ig-like domain-containing protein [Clostridium kluyveri]